MPPYMTFNSISSIYIHYIHYKVEVSFPFFFFSFSFVQKPGVIPGDDPRSYARQVSITNHGHQSVASNQFVQNSETAQ